METEVVISKYQSKHCRTTLRRWRLDKQEVKVLRKLKRPRKSIVILKSLFEQLKKPFLVESKTIESTKTKQQNFDYSPFLYKKGTSYHCNILDTYYVYTKQKYTKVYFIKIYNIYIFYCRVNHLYQSPIIRLQQYYRFL